MMGCASCQQSVEQLVTDNNGATELSIFKIREYFKIEQNKCLSVWFWLILREIINEYFDENQLNNQDINITLLYNWISIQAR